MANGNGTSGHEQELVNVQDLKATLKKSGNKGLFNTATCSTAAGTAAKTVNAPLSFSLEDGAKIIVEFSNGITVANATLQVGDTAAKPIYFRGAPLEADVVKSATSLLLSYNGTVYNIIGSIGLDGDDVYTKTQIDTLLSKTTPKLSVANYTSTGSNYTIFASVSSSSTSRVKDCTVLVAGAGYYYNGDYTGVWLVEMRSSRGGVPKMRVTCIAEPNTSANVTFGYYTDTTLETTYFGVRSTSRMGGFNVTTLVNNSNLFTIEALTPVTEAPDGWTAAYTYEIAVKTDLANEKLGNGIGACSTSSGSALEVTLSGYRLVKNGFVAVTFANDVPANATLNINSRGAKSIIYKGTAIEAGIIKAGDTALLAYDGTNYVLVSGGGESVTGTIIVNLEAYVNDAKTAGSELVGVEVTLTYTSDSEVVGTHTIASGESSVTFRGLAPMKNYTVSVSGIIGYTQPAAQTIASLGIGATASKTFQYEADEYTVSISSNQGSGDTDISGATVAIAGSNISDGGTKKVAKGTSVNPTASDVTGYAKAITTSGKTVSVVYSTEVVEVTCSAYDSSSVAGQTITINGTQYTLGSTGVVIAKVAFGTQYSIVASQWAGYRTPATQTYTANQVSRSVSMEWVELILGVFIESTDHQLYTSSQWASAEKTANAIVVLAENTQFRMALFGVNKVLGGNTNNTNIDSYLNRITDQTLAMADYNGSGNTNAVVSGLESVSGYDSSCAFYICKHYLFPDGTGNSYVPSLGQLKTLYDNKTYVDACLTACNGTSLVYSNKTGVSDNGYIWGSTGNYDATGQGATSVWVLRWDDGDIKSLYEGYVAGCYNQARPFQDYV